MRKNKLFAKKSKCMFGTSHVEYLGHVILAKGVAIDPSKIKAMQEWPIPSNVKKLRGFLGLTSYYKRFIINFASNVMLRALVLALPDFTKSYKVEADASGVGIGVVLQQNGNPIAYMSKTLSLKHQSLSTYKKEFLAVLLALEKWRGYLLDRHFIIKIDHFSLKVQTSKLFSMITTLVTTELAKNIEDSWAIDEKLQAIITKLQAGQEAKKHYVWSNNQLIRKGVKCKPDLAAYPGLLQPLPIPKNIWTSISMDFIEGLPKLQGKNVIFVVVDRLSKYAHFIALSHPFTAHKVAEAFLDNVYKLHGMPESIVSDRDKVFLSNFWSELFKLLQVLLLKSTYYHPQTDGQTEVVNICLEGYLRCMIGEHPKEWARWLSLAELWYNSNFYTSIQTTPFESVYGIPPPIHVPYLGDLSKVKAMDKTLKEREEFIQTLKFHLLRVQNRMKQQADRGRSERNFKAGDWVLLKLQPHRQVTVRMGKQHKFSPEYYGPFKVISKVGQVAYQLELNSQAQIQNVFHVSQLKGYKGEVSSGQLIDIPLCDQNGMLAAQPLTILDRKMVKKKNVVAVYGLVQWTNGNS
ncbi:transposon ty3-I gag-pol polyprotein [Tanacetum coccineum]